MSLFRASVAVFIASVVIAAFAAGAETYLGSYGGSARGVNATLQVAASGEATLAYSLKTSCGRTRGKITLGKSGSALAGKRLSRGPRASLRTIKVKLQPRRSLTETGGAAILLAQLSDPHIHLDAGEHDPCAGLAAAVAAVLALKPQPHAVIVTGDLASGPSPDEYERVCELLAPLTMAVHVIPGNHDDPALMRERFPLGPDAG